jgi:hypothetical protein
MRVSKEPVCIYLFSAKSSFYLPAFEISRSCRTASGKVVVHSNPPYAMAWTAQHICVAGPDKKVVFYTQEGLLAQQFDYFRCNFYFILLEQAICGLGSKY